MPVGSEGLAGHHGHVGLRQQAFGEAQRAAHAIPVQRRRDVGVGVERAARLGAGHSRNGAQAPHHEIAPPPVFGEHGVHRSLRPQQGFHGGLLGN